MPRLTRPTGTLGQTKSTPPTSEPLARPGEIVELRPLGTVFDSHESTLLVNTSNIKIFQQFIPAGGTVPIHEAQGEMVVHCIQGRASLSALGRTHNLKTGQLLYLHVNEPFSILGIEHTSLLVTIIVAKQGSNVELIGE